MKRRDFIKGAVPAAAGLAAASSLSAPAYAQGKRQLKLVTTWPKNFPGLGTGAQRYADRITAMTDGTLEVKLLAAGELVPPFESFDAVSTGTADMYHGAEYYWQGKSPAFNFFAAVPFGLTATEMNAWIYHSGGQEVWDELSAKFNIKAMPCGNTGVQMGGWFNKEINSLDDFKGLTMRMPGLGGEVLRKIGATAVALPGGEIFPALQSGAIDATEWVGPWNDLAFGFYRIAKFYYYPGFHEPGATLSTGINLDTWNELTESQKAIVEAAAKAENTYMLAEFNAQNGNALNTLVNEHNVQLKKFPDDVLKAIGQASGEVIADLAAKNEDVKKVYDSFIKFRKNAMEWASVSDQAYWEARALDYPYGE
ncbi:TRAP transporter substrate-binding protein [Caenispirillum salinarum]|uniref:TRAP transporter substrate-binding protein n=1 Tax=Caenispirillum salinarum TaxID=859058 RepID=UPI00384D3CD0